MAVGMGGGVGERPKKHGLDQPAKNKQKKRKKTHTLTPPPPPPPIPPAWLEGSDVTKPGFPRDLHDEG